MMLPGRRLVWPVWQRPLGWQALLHLTARPELAAAADQDYRTAQRARRQLQQWTVTRLLIATAVRRTMHAKSSYELWTDADDIDLRALR